jgi:hypothetical protein
MALIGVPFGYLKEGNLRWYYCHYWCRSSLNRLYGKSNNHDCLELRKTSCDGEVCSIHRGRYFERHNFGYSADFGSADLGFRP